MWRSRGFSKAIKVVLLLVVVVVTAPAAVVVGTFDPDGADALLVRLGGGGVILLSSILEFCCLVVVNKVYFEFGSPAIFNDGGFAPIPFKLFAHKQQKYGHTVLEHYRFQKIKEI